MIIPGEIVDNELRIAELDAQIEVLNNTGAIPRLILRRHLESRLSMLNKKQISAIDTFLKQNDPKYAAIVQQNFELLQTPKLYMSVYIFGHKPLGNYTKMLKGRITENGYSYLSPTHTESALLPIYNSKVPSQLAGHIDHWGNLDLQSTRTLGEWTMGKAQKIHPKTYYGSIDEKGEIYLNALNHVRERIPARNMVMSRLIGNHFQGKQHEVNKFLGNKNQLKVFISEFRKSIF